MNATLPIRCVAFGESRVAYSYLGIYALATLPGMRSWACVTVALRPIAIPRSELAIRLSIHFVRRGRWGVPDRSLVWMVAVRSTRRVFPRWLGIQLCNALTEVSSHPRGLQDGAFAGTARSRGGAKCRVLHLHTVFSRCSEVILRKTSAPGVAGSRDRPAWSLRRVKACRMSERRRAVEADRFVPGQPDMWASSSSRRSSSPDTSRLTWSAEQNIDLFLQSQAHLDMRVGVFNTLVCWAALVRGALRTDRPRGLLLSSAHETVPTMLFGGVFLAEGARWNAKLGRGLSQTSSSLLYFLTALH